jgi:hypothetical protein
MRCVCGWTAVISAPTDAARTVVKRNAPLPLKLRLELDQLLAKFKRHEEKKVERVRTHAVSPEVTAGHGGHCFCELCFPRRVNRGKARVGVEDAGQREGESDGSAKE